MGVKCLLGKHNWNGCRCDSCGLLRNEEHDYQIDKSICVEVCTRCGKQGDMVDYYHQKEYIKHIHGDIDWRCEKCGATGGASAGTRLGYYIFHRDFDKFNWQEREIMIGILNNAVNSLRKSTDYASQSKEWHSVHSMWIDLKDHKLTTVSKNDLEIAGMYIVAYLASVNSSFKTEKDKNMQQELFKIMFYGSDIPKKINDSLNKK